MTRLAAIVVVVVAAALVPVAVASEAHPTLNELENEVMCPVCNTTLAQSDSDAARAIERVVRAKIDAGWTKSRIKDFLVRSYGRSILAAPPKKGFDLLAWLLPLGGIVIGGALLGVAAWRWSRGRADAEPLPTQSLNGRGRVDPELERRLDEELARFE